MSWSLFSPDSVSWRRDGTDDLGSARTGIAETVRLTAIKILPIASRQNLGLVTDCHFDPSQDDDLASLNVARGWLPRTHGKKISLDTLYRWCQKGLKNGVRLEAVKIGSRWYTTRKWVQDFIRAGKPKSKTILQFFLLQYLHF